MLYICKINIIVKESKMLLFIASKLTYEVLKLETEYV